MFFFFFNDYFLIFCFRSSSSVKYFHPSQFCLILMSKEKKPCGTSKREQLSFPTVCHPEHHVRLPEFPWRAEILSSVGRGGVVIYPTTTCTSFSSTIINLIRPDSPFHTEATWFLYTHLEGEINKSMFCTVIWSISMKIPQVKACSKTFF